jgi:hypothetical protein
MDKVYCELHSKQGAERECICGMGVKQHGGAGTWQHYENVLLAQMHAKTFYSCMQDDV